MRKIIFFILFLSFPGIVSAAGLAEASVVMDRNSVGASPLPVLVKVKTENASVENNLQIDIGKAWTINAPAVSVANLPVGVTPWPGVGIDNVFGNTINLSSSDLNSHLTYGFYLTNGISNNPNNSLEADRKWKITTGGVSTEVKILLVNNDQVTVNGKVGAMASDFQVEINSDNTNTLKEGNEVSYQIKYGSYLLNSTKPLVIIGEWSRGTVAGSPIPSVDIVDYVIGSGSSGYVGVMPVIDLINRKITWTINSFPANTLNQVVSFKLRVNDNYSGSSNVGFDVSAILSGANVVTTDSKISQTFQPAVIPTAILTVVPTSISINPTSVPNPTPQIKKIEVVSITDSAAKIAVENNFSPRALKIIYGKLAAGLNQSITSLNGLQIDWLKINELASDTEYLFKIQVKNADGKIINSDVYTFRTAIKSDTPVINQGSVVVSVANNIVLDASKEKNSVNAVVMIPGEKYALRINLTNPEKVKKAQIFIRNTQVLGINTIYGAEPNSTGVDLTELVNGGFVGHLVTPLGDGYFDIVLRIEDINGNVVEETVGQLRIVKPMVVVDESMKPVENASVKISRYNEKTKIFEIISADFLGIKNPSFTEPDGTLRESFPKGRYQIEVSEVGFETKTVEFSVGMGVDEKLPIVSLKEARVGITDWIKYYGLIGSHVIEYSDNSIMNLLKSQRFFKLIVVLVEILAIVVGWLFLAKGRNLEWWMLPVLVVNKIKRFKNKKDNLYGQIVDKETKKPIQKAVVYLVDGGNYQILAKAKSGILGDFEISMLPAKNYKIVVACDGYETTDILDYTLEGLLANNLIINMENSIGRGEVILINIGLNLEKIGWIGLRMLVILLLIVELKFASIFGWQQVVPWLFTLVISGLLVIKK